MTTIIATTNSYAITSEILNSLKFEVIPNAIRLQKFDEAVTSVNCERAEDTILFVGMLIPVKGVNYLIEAAKMITEEYPQTNLLIVGQGENKRS